jgi:uncharacterized iron-regulated membrane protein
MSLRRIVFWIHLPVGIVTALVVLMMSVTGVILTYEMQINRWALRGYRAEPAASGAALLSVDTLLHRVAAAVPEATPASIVLRADPLEPAAVRVGGGLSLFVDRYTGQVVGDSDVPMRRALRQVMYWHRWFALEDDSRAIGRAVTGAANLGFLFLVVSGLYLWWPRAWTRAVLRNVAWFRSGLGGKARDFNWHNVIGVWVAVPLVIIVFSGATISYRWVGNLVYTTFGELPPGSTSASPAGAAGEEDAKVIPPPVRTLDYAALVDRAAAETSGWQIITLRLPDSDHAPVNISVDRGTGRQPSKRVDLTLDRATGKILERGGYGTFTRALKVRRWLRFAHTGEVYGFVGQTVAGVATIGACVLVWTGLSLSWRRFFGQG